MSKKHWQHKHFPRIGAAFIIAMSQIRIVDFVNPRRYKSERANISYPVLSLAPHNLSTGFFTADEDQARTA